MNLIMNSRRLGLVYYHYEDNYVNRRRSQSVHEFDHEQSDADATKVYIQFDAESWENSRFSFRRLWAYMGPGWLMSIAYLDPGNLESDLQGGAQAGYQLIWVLFWATVGGWVMQNLASRLGVVTGRHLAEICRTEYDKATALILWLLTELAIIGSDIQEIVGSAIAFKLLFGLPLIYGCFITALDTFTFMLVHYYGVRKLEALVGFLITTMAITFGINFFRDHPDYSSILEGWVVPKCDNDNVEFAVGLIGAVIMPHNLFLHSALVHSRAIPRDQRGAVAEANYYFIIESAISLLLSFIINLFVVAVFARGFYGTPGADDIGLEEAGDVLRDRFGKSSMYIWGVGLLAAGQSSTMTGTFAGQYAMQGFLNIRWAPWKRTLLTRSIALIPAVITATISEGTGVLDDLDEWLNVQQSVQLPFALLPLLVFNCDRRIMGDFTLSLKMKIFYWALAIFVIGINVYIAIDTSIHKLPHHWLTWFGFSVFIFLYLGFVAWLVFDYLKNVYFSQPVQADKYSVLRNSEKKASEGPQPL